MPANPEYLIRSLERFAGTLPSAVEGHSAEDAAWRPAEDKWSLLEIVGHLGDEELDDFRPRLASTLEDPTRAWPPIDPERAVRDRNHQDADLRGLVQRFLDARADSLTWLRGLDSPSWENCYSHPILGPVRAGDLLVSWAAHDLIHLQQLVTQLRALTENAAGEYSAAYAGG